MLGSIFNNFIGSTLRGLGKESTQEKIDEIKNPAYLIAGIFLGILGKFALDSYSGKPAPKSLDEKEVSQIIGKTLIGIEDEKTEGEEVANQDNSSTIIDAVTTSKEDLLNKIKDLQGKVLEQDKELKEVKAKYEKLKVDNAETLNQNNLILTALEKQKEKKTEQ